MRFAPCQNQKLLFFYGCQQAQNINIALEPAVDRFASLAGPHAIKR
jgi:hypothetical protein